jgi:hypothetical protein
MLVLALACSSPTPATTPDDPTDDPVDVPDEDPSTERGFDPTTFTVAGTFAIDGDRVVGWTRLYSPQAPYILVSLRDDRPGGDPIACDVELVLAEGTLESWDIDATWFDGFGPHDVTLAQRGFATAAAVSTTCPPLDADIWGTASAADLVAQWQWGLGAGEALPETLGEFPPDAIGGSVYADLLPGDFPADAQAWSTASEVDEDGALVVDIYGQTHTLPADEALVATRAQYHVEALMAYDAAMLRR